MIDNLSGSLSLLAVWGSINAVCRCTRSTDGDGTVHQNAQTLDSDQPRFVISLGSWTMFCFCCHSSSVSILSLSRVYFSFGVMLHARSLTRSPCSSLGTASLPITPDWTRNRSHQLATLARAPTIHPSGSFNSCCVRFAFPANLLLRACPIARLREDRFELTRMVILAETLSALNAQRQEYVEMLLLDDFLYAMTVNSFVPLLWFKFIDGNLFIAVG